MAERPRPAREHEAPASARRGGSQAGLCDSCAHQQLVHNTRGSTFSLCTRSRDDPAYPRYPRLPVLACPGYERLQARS
jgi:hypothetical protein